MSLMSKKTIIKVMIILYVVLMIVLPIGIYLMDNQKAPAKWTLGINTESQSLSLTGDSFSLKEVNFNQHPLLISQTNEGAVVDEVKLSRPTHNELTIINKENRQMTVAFSMVTTSGDQVESVYIRSSFPVAVPRFAINSNQQLLTEQSTYESNFILKGEKQLYLDLVYQKAPPTEKLASFFVASTAGMSQLSHTVMPYVVRSFHVVGKVVIWVASGIWKAIVWCATGLARGVLWLVSAAMDHRGAVWQVTKNVSASIVHAVIELAKMAYKGLSFVVVGTAKILWLIGRVIVSTFQYVIWNGGRALFHGGQFLIQFVIALGQDVVWYSGQALRSTVQGSHYFFVDGPNERRILKLSLLMKLPRQRIGVAEGVTLDFVCLDFQGAPAAGRAVNVQLKSTVPTDYILLSPDRLTTNALGQFSVRLQTGRETSVYHFYFLCSGQKFHARIDAMPTKPVQIVSLKDQLTYVAPIGTLMKDAFQVKVYDRFQNPVPFAKVDWYTLLPGVTESVKFLEARTDRKGYLKMDYRMDDMARSYWVQAHLVGTARRLNYNMQSLAVNPENMIPLGEEDQQIIVGTPLKKPFVVKVTDHFDNPVPNIVVAFTLQDDQQEAIVEKEIRTNRKGMASIRLNTLKRTGEYSLLVSSEKLPDSDVGFTISVQPGNVASVSRISGNAQSAYWGKLASIPLRVRATDTLGNPIAGLPVKWMGDPDVVWDEAEPETDDQGYAAAKVGTRKTSLKVVHPLAEVAGQQVNFDLYPKEPSMMNLYLASSPVVKVMVGKMLPADIDLVLRDQYGRVLASKSIDLEYMVIRSGVTYQQKLSRVTNKMGQVTFNFVASDQKDEINVKAKYYNGKDTIMTWIKVDVVPSGVSRLVVLPESIQAVVGQKIDRPVRLLLIDQKGFGMSGIPLDVTPLLAPANELKHQKGLRQKTNRQGVVYFFPLLGKTAGEYVYQVKMMNQDTRFTVKAVAGRTESLSIRPPKQRSFVAGSMTRGFMVRALDAFGNPAVGEILSYGVGEANMKAKVGASGYARLVVLMPKSAASYKLIVTDGQGRVKAETALRVHESVVGSLRWMGEDQGLRARAGATLRQEFPCQVVDAYGNALSNVKMNLDIYDQARSTTLLSVESESKAGGEGRFSLVAPKKMGRYWSHIYPSDWSDIGKWVTFDVAPADVAEVVIVTGDNQLIRAGGQAPTDFTLSMKDRFGNPVFGQDVNWIYQVKQGSDSRFLNTVTKTNNQGFAVFNLVVDREPGVRELKAFFLRQGKKDKQSFYYKILSNDVSQFQILSGRDQKVYPGRQLPQAIRVRVLNRAGAPIGDAVVHFDIESTNPAHRGQLQGLSVHTNKSGIASAFLVSPSLQGKYKIKITVADHANLSDVALLTVL